MNTITISGRLGGDPEVSEVNDSKVANFSVAEDHGYGTNWFDVAAWGSSAEFVQKHFEKGDGIEVTGSLEFEGDDGQYVTIRSRNIGFPPSSPNQGEDGDFGDADDEDDVPF